MYTSYVHAETNCSLSISVQVFIFKPDFLSKKHLLNLIAGIRLSLYSRIISWLATWTLQRKKGYHFQCEMVGSRQRNCAFHICMAALRRNIKRIRNKRAEGGREIWAICVRNSVSHHAHIQIQFQAEKEKEQGKEYKRKKKQSSADNNMVPI